MSTSSSSLELPQPCRQFTISEILEATQNFDESFIVGRGGFGKVYRGTIINGAGFLDVAIKQLGATSNQGAFEFWAEVKMLSTLRHCHLVSLIGFCNDDQEMILVYEYMPHGTLEDHLHKRGGIPLPWPRRLKICIEVARGLHYLHTGTGIEHGVIHRDVKSSNVSLDNNWTAKISDFGLSKMSATNQSFTGISTLVKGTFGYLDPHYFTTGRPTIRTDVYSFGVVLLEVLCGKRALDSSIDEELCGLVGWAQNPIKEGRLERIVDGSLEGRASPKCLKEFAQLAERCLHSNPKQRPSMEEVVAGLKFVLALQEKAKDTLQPRGMTIFGSEVPMFRSPTNVEQSVVENLKSLDRYLYAIGGENRMLSRFDFATLKVATNNFSRANLVVDGYHLGRMYKGKLQNGQKIAILRNNKYNRDRFTREMIMNDVSILAKLEHENLLLVLGYCIHGTKLFLVYKIALYATMKRSLFDTPCILKNWNKRYKILLGVARVLLYLHKHAPIRVVYCNLGPSDILLDEDLDPKLSHFGFAKCLAINETDCIVHDYMSREVVAPEYFRRRPRRLSCKADVFCFGVMVLETISGIERWKFRRERKYSMYFDEYAERIWLDGKLLPIDPKMRVDSSLMTRFIEIGLLCIQKDLEDRPAMEEVVDMLLGASSPTLRLSKIRKRKLSEIQERRKSKIPKRKEVVRECK